MTQLRRHSVSTKVQPKTPNEILDTHRFRPEQHPDLEPATLPNQETEGNSARPVSSSRNTCMN